MIECLFRIEASLDATMACLLEVLAGLELKFGGVEYIPFDEYILVLCLELVSHLLTRSFCCRGEVDIFRIQNLNYILLGFND